MKKNLVLMLMLAGLGTAATATAQSSVTVYGILDAGYGFEQYRYHQQSERARATHSGFRDGYLKSNRFGIRGSEKIGEDLRAIFHLESEFYIGTGQMASSHFFHRKSIVGLSGNRWGTVTLGRQKDLSDDFLDLNVTKSLGKMKRTFGASGVRRDDLIKYLSPTFSGFRFGAGYAPGGRDPVDDGFQSRASDREHFVTMGVQYEWNSWHVAASIDREKTNDKSGHTLGYAVTNWIAGASHDFGWVQLTLAYGQDRNGKMKSPGNVDGKTFGSYEVQGLGDFNSEGFRSKNYYVGLSAPVASGRVGLSWTRTSSNLSRIYARNHPGQRLADSTQNIVAAMYDYPLSKRTRLYAYAAAGNGLAYIDGLRERETGFGLNHRF